MNAILERIQKSMIDWSNYKKWSDLSPEEQAAEDKYWKEKEKKYRKFLAEDHSKDLVFVIVDRKE